MPKVSGRVVEVPVQPNVPVKKGNALFRIDPREFQYNVDRFKDFASGAGYERSAIVRSLHDLCCRGIERANMKVALREWDFDTGFNKRVVHGDSDVTA